MEATLHKQWNVHPQVARIHITGNLGQAAGLRRKVDLHDLPGANNSLDAKQWQLAIDTLSNVQWNLLCFVLDATAPDTTDEHALLRQVRAIAKTRPQAKLLFILNKVDEIDSDRDESIEAMVHRIRQRLVRLGLNDAWVVPSMARIALVARLQMARGAVSARQKMAYQAMAPQLSATARAIFAATHVPKSVCDRLLPELQALHCDEFRVMPAMQSLPFPFLSASATASGIRTVEGVIHHCLANS